MARWPQYAGVRRVPLSGFEYEDQYMIVRSLHSGDARDLSWSRLSEQSFRLDKWSVCRG